ncbi:MAG: hypothetical protein K1X78_27785 [Verrucomicrobiaceae bacterium]|nr:hypothetical protein [Verrucomicrobiaceae bacterium]
MTAAQKTGFKFGAAKHTDINATLRALEQTLLDPAGLPGRDWFRRMIHTDSQNECHFAHPPPEGLDLRWTASDARLLRQPMFRRPTAFWLPAQEFSEPWA